MVNYIGIAGTMGAGKTTLARQLGDALDIAYIKEPISPYLADFYKDNARWAFHMQVYMMTARAKGCLILSRFGGIQDRTIFEDKIFQNMLTARGDLSYKDWNVCDMLYKALHKPKPRVILYLKVSPETSIQRQKERAIEKEVGITDNYLTDLCNRYDEWAEEYTGNIITLDWNNPCDVEEVIERL